MQEPSNFYCPPAKPGVYLREITMGPTGAAFLGKDGPGNVDHIMWVTMTEDGPQMGNIALKGLFNRKGLDPEMFAPMTV